jgi:phage terminase small subunit
MGAALTTEYSDHGIDCESGLTLKQRLFCDIYLTCLNATKAYREAGYAADSHGTARTESSKLLARPDIQAWVKEKMRERQDRLSVSAERVLTELVVVALSNVNDYVVNHDTAQLEVRPGVPQEALRAVRWFRVTRRTVNVERDGRPASETTVTSQVYLWDKLKAIESLCKHLGLTEAKLPPLEVLLNRLPTNVANVLRQLLAARPQPDAAQPTGPLRPDFGAFADPGTGSRFSPG